ncbi:hypothetical protein JOF34_000766 [Microbacterium amylolyticum]|uniref:Uncharacterized protein n=1 Tax=Microbacterium amylolyticum TaxID=936337 RepID=A0ABS4ZFX3_9MICO|nr:hypothetical protein [Microbacterium amylolyticum]
MLKAEDAVSLDGPAGLARVSTTARETGEVLPGDAVQLTREIRGIAPLGWISGALTVAPAAVGIGAQPLDAVTVDVSSPAVSWSMIALLAIVILIAVSVTTFTARLGSARLGQKGHLRELRATSPSRHKVQHHRFREKASSRSSGVIAAIAAYHAGEKYSPTSEDATGTVVDVI